MHAASKHTLGHFCVFLTVNAYLAQAQLDVELVRMRGTATDALVPRRRRCGALPQALTRPCPVSRGPARWCCGCARGSVQRCDQQPPIEGLPGLGQAGLQALASRVDVQAARKGLPAPRTALMDAAAEEPCLKLK